MSTPATQPQPQPEPRTKPSLGVALVIYATFTLLAVRWTGFAALPFLVIFAPVLTLVGILALTFVLIVIAALASAGAESNA